VKLLDFGISKAANPLAAPSTGLTSTGMVMGSPRYMSPEQLKSTKNVDARSDIWSLGVVLYELLSGRTPFDGDTLGAVMATVLEAEVPPLNRADVPPSLVAVIGRCMARKPEQRFASAADLAAALRPFALPATVVAIDRLSQHYAGLRASPEGTSAHVSTAASQMLNQTGASWTPDASTVRRGSAGGLKLVVGATGALLVLVALGAAFFTSRGAPAPVASSASVEVKTEVLAPSAPTPVASAAPARNEIGSPTDPISLDELPPVASTGAAPADSSGAPPFAEAQPVHMAGRVGPAHSGQARPLPRPPVIDHPPATQAPTTYDPSHDSRK
jgi:serine/threonine-protein kinase